MRFMKHLISFRFFGKISATVALAPSLSRELVNPRLFVTALFDRRADVTRPDTAT